MFEMYCKNIPLSRDLDPQESMHGEELLSITCNILVQVCYISFLMFFFIWHVFKFILKMSYPCYSFNFYFRFLFTYEYTSCW